MSDSAKSSLPPKKPSSCADNDWRDLEFIIQATDDEINVLESAGFVKDTNITVEVIDLARTDALQKDVSDEGFLISTSEKQNILNLEEFKKTDDDKAGNTPKPQEEDVACENVENEPFSDNDNKTLTKKRKKDPSNWKQNKRKYNRQHGKEYVNVKGNRVEKKKVSDKMCFSNEKCSFQCSKKITKDERQLIHDSFWYLSDEKKYHYYSKHVKCKPAERKRTANSVSKKQYSYEYSFIISGVCIRVCQEFFFNTLNISKQRIYYFFKKCQRSSTEMPRTPLLGKHTKKKIPEEKKNQVRSHIQSFPAIESHYCRANSKKVYLDRDLNLNKMYRLYFEETPEPVKFNIYTEIFKSEYNISFFKPKKDMCDKCAEFRTTSSPTATQIEQFNSHIRRKDIGYMERNKDRNRYADDNTVGVVCFDLQNTFSLPRSNVSKNFYKMKLCCYNFTAFLASTKTVYNAIWHEFQSGRAGVHIACALIRLLKQIVLDNPNITKLILWSDSCVPQNKNSIMSFAIQCFLNSEEGRNIKTIEQKFGEPGHGNVQEIDNAHSCIERFLRSFDIWSPLTLIRLLLKIPQSYKLKFKIIQMQPHDYLNYQTEALKFNYSVIPFTKVKTLIYDRDDVACIKYKESFEGPESKAKLTFAGRLYRDKLIKLPDGIPRIVERTIPVPPKKKKHLMEMMPQMPDDEKEFYRAILKIS